MYRRIGVLFGALALALVACGVAATPTPGVPIPGPFGCFSALEAERPGAAFPVAQPQAEGVARDYFERMRGATLARYTDADGAQRAQPPREARPLLIRSSPYGQDLDPLRGREVWLLGFTVEQAAIWSTLKPGANVYALIDARTAVLLLDCTAPSA